MKDTLLSDDAQQHLWNTPELDYLTHVVFRMYENKRYVVRVVMLFSFAFYSPVFQTQQV